MVDRWPCAVVSVSKFPPVSRLPRHARTYCAFSLSGRTWRVINCNFNAAIFIVFCTVDTFFEGDHGNWETVYGHHAGEKRAVYDCGGEFTAPPCSLLPSGAAMVVRFI